MPILDRPLVLAILVAYFLALVLLGAWAARRTHTARDYFIAGQGLGLGITTLATMSAAFSGFVFLGGPGLTYRMGMASLWIVVPIGFTPSLLCWVVARKLRLLSEVRELFTVPDAIACRYGSRWAAGLAAVAVALGTLCYLGAQMLALGVLLQSTLGMSERLPAIALGAALLLGYCVFGGMVAGVYTDVLQGALMLVAAVMVFFRALDVTGGYGKLTEAITTSERFGASFLDPLGNASVFTAFGFFFVFGIGVLGQPHMLHKFYMLDDPRKLKWMPLTLGGSQAVCLLLWIGVGLAVPALVARGDLPVLDDPDRAAPAFLLAHAPPWLTGLVLAAVLSAILSTADSLINVGAAALVRDLPRALGRELGRELACARVAVVGVGLGSAALAWAYGDLIALLGTLAFGIFGASLAPALAIGLNWERVTARAATASIATGLGSSVILELLSRQRLLPSLAEITGARGVLPAAVALAASFLVLIVVTACSRTTSGSLDPEVRRIVES